MAYELDKQPFPVCLLAITLFGISSMLDSGKHDGINFDQIKHHARRGDLIAFLKSQADGYFASNILDSHPIFAKWYVGKIHENCVAMEDRERRKYGIEKRGLCLLLSYTAEILQSDKVPLEFTNYEFEKQRAKL